MRRITLALILLSFSLFAFTQNDLIKLNQSNPENYNIEIIEQTADGLIIKLSINSYRLQEVSTPRGLSYVVKTPKCRNIEQKGSPDLPYVTSALAIPDNGGIKYEVISSNFQSVTNIDIAPSKGTIYRNVDPATVPYEYGREYQTNKFFPANLSTMTEPYIMRDMRGSNITIFPFTYNAINKELRIYDEIIIRIKFNKEPAVNELISTKEIRNSDFNGIYERTFLNYSSSAKYTALNEGTPGNILIIAKDTYASAMAPYINWKLEKGIETEMVLMSTIGTTSAQVKTFIQNYYNTKGLTYVLLIGDAADVPVIKVSNNDTDNGYTYIVGSDGYADIFIGRFSGNTLSDIQTQVERTVHYEKDLSTSDTWLANAFNSASSEGGGNNGHNGGESDMVHMGYIKTDLENYGYSVTSVNQSGGSNSQVSTAFNNGVGIANYIGHGDTQMWVNTSFTNTQVNALTNINKLPFIWSVACVNGDFNGKTCFGEAWLRATNSGKPTGAIAFFGSTINQSWNDPMTGQDEMVDILMETYPSNIKRTFGGLSFNGMFKMIQEGGQGQVMADTWTIFGDPSLMVRSKTPQNMTISHLSTITVGQDHFQVDCNIDEALISLTKVNGENVEIIGIGYANGGSADIELEAFNTPGEMLVTVTAFNKVTYQDNVLVIVPEGPYVVHKSYTINDSDANNNGIAEYNETIYINQSLNNVGIEIANGVHTSLSISNSGIEVTDNEELFGEIAVSGIITKDLAYTVVIPNGIADQTNLAANLVITDNDSHEWNATYFIPVSAPVMLLSFSAIDDSELGNDNGILDAGETVNIIITVKNIGHAASVAGNVAISSANEFVNINTSSVNIAAQSVNSPTTVSFEVSIDESIAAGATVCFNFDLTAGMYTANLNSCLPAGLQNEDWESNTMTTYEWENSTTYPWTIVTNQVYEGTYALKSGTLPSSGGESTLIINLDVLNADNVAFYKKVSCEGLYWGTMFDYLAFAIDGSMKGQWCGEVAWSNQTYPVAAGTRELKWTYAKDGYQNTGSDCAWIDNIKLPAHQTSITIINTAENIYENSVDVYPNPASDVAYLNVNLSNDTKATVKVMNISGQVVYEYSNEFNLYSGRNSILINTSEFANGLYIINVTTSEKTYQRNLVITK